MRTIRWFVGIALAVDLTIDPLGGTIVPSETSVVVSAGASAGSIKTDPARLAHIRDGGPTTGSEKE